MLLSLYPLLKICMHIKSFIFVVFITAKAQHVSTFCSGKIFVSSQTKLFKKSLAVSST